MEAFVSVSGDIKNFICSDFFIILVLGCAIYFSIRMIFPQFRLFGDMFRSLFDNEGSDDGISPFQAFMTALGARVGVGNVAGVATAIAFGGPGAIFWIWVFGLLGSAVAIVEAVMGQAYKIKDGDEYLGGPAYYIERGFKKPCKHKFTSTVSDLLSKYLSKIFAVIALIGFGLLMPGIQSNTVVNSVVNGFHSEKTITIIITAILIALIIWGGIKRIGKIESVLTPFKCIAYLLFAIIVIVYNAEYLGQLFSAIFSSAFGINPVLGGIAGSALAMGIRRGMLSTDVGYGPGGIFAAAARCDHPMKQGLLQGLSVLLSTLIICTATALIIMLSGSFRVEVEGNVIFTAQNYPGIAAGAEWVQNGLNEVPFLHGWAPQILAIMIAIFATGTIVGYYYLIESNLRFLTKKTTKSMLTCVKILFLASLVVSTLVDSSSIWNVADIGMGLMGWINIIVLILLSPTACRIVKDYSVAKRKGIKPVFRPEDYDIVDDTGAWALEGGSTPNNKTTTVASKTTTEK